MKNLQHLVTLMQDLEEQLVACMRCGMCQAVCPLYAETGLESDVARGKLSMLDAMLKGQLKDAESTRERLNKCLLCGSCAANCPSGVSVLSIFLRARSVLNGYLGLPSAKKAVLRNLLAKPKRFDRIALWAAALQKLATRPVNETVGTSCARFFPGLIGNRHLHSLAKAPFHRRRSHLDIPAAKGKPRVLFFTGCLIDKVYPEIAEATIKALQHHGFGIIIPEATACCGIPAISAGDAAAFEKLVHHNLARFSEAAADYIVTSCATCTATLKHIWPEMMPRETALEKQLKEISVKTLDISELLVSHECLTSDPPPAISNAIPVTYHDPCHLKKSLGVAEQPRQLIRANPGYILREMANADQCCGMGGSFNLQYYDISSSIGQKKRDRIAATGAETVATGCPACMLQLADQLSKKGDTVRIRHFIEIYAQTL